MIKKFHDGIGFSFWHHFSRDCGTAIRYHRFYNGLFGVRFSRPNDTLEIGFWWTIGFSLCAVPQSRFETPPAG